MGLDELAEQRAKKDLRASRLDSATTVLMNAYGNQIYRYCLTTLGNQADAEDILQIVFVQAFEGMPKFKGNSSFRTWLYSIARHRCLDKLKTGRRLKARVQFTDDPPDVVDDKQVDSDPGLSRALIHCLAELSEKVREVIVMRYQADLSYAEISEAVGEKPGTLQARVARSLPTLRRCVQSFGVTL